jgi:hypothetical protein
MTLVHVRLRDPAADGEDVPAEGRLVCVPTRRRTVADTVVVPAKFTAVLADGNVDLELAPTTGSEWAWRIQEFVRGGAIRFVAVPDTTEVGYEDLVDVDPETLDPAAAPSPAWALELAAEADQRQTTDELLLERIDSNAESSDAALATEATARADADTALDGRLDTIEGAAKIVQADTTGVSNAAAAIQSAYSDLSKGTLYIPPGDYLLSSGLVFDASKPVAVVQAIGAVLKPASSVAAVTWVAESLPVSNARHVNLQVNGGITTGTDGPTASNGTVGLVLKNVTFALVDHLNVTKCDTGVKLLSAKNTAGTALWCEHNRLDGDVTYCNVAVDVVTTDGTGSFAGTDITRMNIDRCHVGIRQDAASSLYRSRFTGIQMWLRQDQVGWDLSGNLDGVKVECAAEAITGTNQTLFHFRSTAQNVYTVHARLKSTAFDEVVNRRITNDTSGDNFWYQSGTADLVIDSAEKTTDARWRLRRPGWTRGAIEATFGGSGGALVFGPGGTSAPDSRIERQGSNLLGLAAGDSFALEGTYNGGHLLLGSNHLWLDATGKLRIKASAPSSDTDGTLVNQTVLTAYRTTDSTPVNNSTAPVSDGVITLAVEANSTYLFDATIFYDASTAGDFNVGWASPTGSSGYWMPDCIGTGASGTSAASAHSRNAITSSVGAGGVGVGTVAAMHATGMLIVGSTAGSFTLKYAQNTADATDATLRAGTALTLRKVA